jgi:hypothetical protein
MRLTEPLQVRAHDHVLKVMRVTSAAAATGG